MTFGEKLQYLRKQNGLSQEQLASKLTVSRQAISKWELGSSLPDTEKIVQISIIFNVSTDYLLKEDIEQITNLSTPPITPTAKLKRGLSAKIMMYGGGLGILVFWILSSVFPTYTSVGDASANGDVSRIIVKTGLPAFLEMNNMELLFIMCSFIFVIGTAMYIFPFVKAKAKRRK